MNHGFKINGNILEITLPEEVHINRVLVNRQIFSQRQRVCESCKYHEKEGHEEPCVSCEVGNSNYVPSVELEEHTEEHTETHACDLIDREAAIDALEKDRAKLDHIIRNIKANDVRLCTYVAQHNQLDYDIDTIRNLPSAQPEIKPIEYRDCANAMLRMWTDNVLTDGEYNRIMDKLNAKYRGKQND